MIYQYTFAYVPNPHLGQTSRDLNIAQSSKAIDANLLNIIKDCLYTLDIGSCFESDSENFYVYVSVDERELVELSELLSRRLFSSIYLSFSALLKVEDEGLIAEISEVLSVPDMGHFRHHIAPLQTADKDVDKDTDKSASKAVENTASRTDTKDAPFIYDLPMYERALGLEADFLDLYKDISYCIADDEGEREAKGVSSLDDLHAACEDICAHFISYGELTLRVDGRAYALYVERQDASDMALDGLINERVFVHDLASLHRYFKPSAKLDALASYERPIMRLAPKPAFMSLFLDIEDASLSAAPSLDFETSYKRDGQTFYNSPRASLKASLPPDAFISLLCSVLAREDMEFVFCYEVVNSDIAEPELAYRRVFPPSEDYINLVDGNLFFHRFDFDSLKGLVSSLLASSYDIDMLARGAKEPSLKDSRQDSAPLPGFISYLSFDYNSILGRIEIDKVANSVADETKERRLDISSIEIVPMVDVYFDASPLALLEALAMDATGARLISNYKDFSPTLYEGIGALATRSSDARLYSGNILDVLGSIALLSGMVEASSIEVLDYSALSYARDALYANAELYIRDKGPRISYKLYDKTALSSSNVSDLKDLRQVEIASSAREYLLMGLDKASPRSSEARALLGARPLFGLDYTSVISSTLSFHLAGLDAPTLAFGVLDSLGEFIGTIASDFALNYRLGTATYVGNALFATDLSDRLLHYRASSLPLLLPKIGYLDIRR